MDYLKGPYSSPFGTLEGAKAGPGAQTPMDASQVQWKYLEPLLTPEQLRNRYLFGIPLVSNVKDPITGRHQVMTDDLLQDIIERAVEMVEADTSLDIAPKIIEEKAEFDQAEYLQFGFFKLKHRPAAAIHKLSVSPSTDQDVFIVPQEWIETGLLTRGQVNIIPMTAALGSGAFIPATSAGGAVFLQLLGNKPWLPSFWLIEYTAGFPDMLIPKLVQEIIGTKAAMETLSLLAATYARSTSHSLSLDSGSQSVSGPGPQLFVQRLTELGQKYDGLRRKLKAKYGQVLFSGNI